MASDGRESGHIGDPLVSLGGVKSSTGRGLVFEERGEVSLTSIHVIFPSNPRRVWALIMNNGDNDMDIYLKSGSYPLLTLRTGGYVLFNKDFPWTGEIWAGSTGTELYAYEASIE